MKLFEFKGSMKGKLHNLELSSYYMCMFDRFGDKTLKW